jgi:soluble lytic murein transglycosylase-like protein
LIFAAAMLAVVPALPVDLQASSNAPAVARWSPYIAEASLRFGVPEAWIAAVVQAESAGLIERDGRPIVSRAGAMGLMQLMPGTWAEMRDLHDLGRDPFDPRDNIFAGAAYLRLMYDRFGYPGLFAAYNAGPDRYAQYLIDGRSLPAETRAYVASLTGTPPLSPRSPAAVPVARLFFTLGRAKGVEPPASDSTDRKPPAKGIFVPLSAPEQGPK